MNLRNVVLSKEDLAQKDMYYPTLSIRRTKMGKTKGNCFSTHM